MNISTHHRVALGCAAVTSAMALTDAVTHGLTGGPSPFGDESAGAAVSLVTNLAHGGTYLALAWVLYAERDRLSATGPFSRVLAFVVAVSLTLLAFGFLVVLPVTDAVGREPGPVADGLFGAAFFGLIFGSLVLGLSLLRSPGLRYAARTLAAMVPVLGVTLLLDVLGSGFAHPAYLETTLHFGLAILGVDAVAHAAAPADEGRAATSSAT